MDADELLGLIRLIDGRLKSGPIERLKAVQLVGLRREALAAMAYTADRTPDHPPRLSAISLSEGVNILHAI